MKPKVLLVASVALAAVVAGCSSEVAGDAAAGGNSVRGNESPSPFPEDAPTGEETTESTAAESGTTELEPCALLTAEDLATLGLPRAPLDQGELGPARACQWQTSGSHTVSVGVLDDLGIDEVQSQSSPESVTVGSHDAVQYRGIGKTCGVTLAVTEMSRVDVIGVAGADTARACEVANQAAELVEPKLP